MTPTPFYKRLVTQAMALQLALIGLVLLIVSLAVLRMERAALEEQYGLRAQAIAESVAEDPTIRELVSSDVIAPEVQRVAEAVRLRTGVDFVVVTDVDGVRHSHPNPERIGQTVSTDPSRALAGISDWYVQVGTLGQSVRGKVPIWDATGEEVVGIVSVGILTGELSDFLRQRRSGLIGIAALAFAAGAVVAVFAARRIRRQTLGLEPPEIAAMYEHRDAMLQALHEGVLAVDDDGRVVLANEFANTALQLQPGDLGRDLNSRGDLAPLLALSGAETSVDVPIQIGAQMLLVTAVPLVIRGKQRGAVFTFRDRTELQGLVSELESAQSLVDALRAQAHEHSNSLHTISGLIELGQNDDVRAIVEDHTAAQRAIGDLYNASSRTNALVVASLLAKAAVAAERDVLLRTHIGELPQMGVRVSRDIVTIVGNLVDNAVDQLTASGIGGGEVEVAIWSTQDRLHIEVSDSGEGIDAGITDKIFEAGFTTKDRRSHDGLGLALVAEIVARYDGSISVDSDKGSGTLFSVGLDVLKRVRPPQVKRETAAAHA